MTLRRQSSKPKSKPEVSKSTSVKSKLEKEKKVLKANKINKSIGIYNFTILAWFSVIKNKHKIITQ